MKYNKVYTIIDPSGREFKYKKIDDPKHKYELVENYTIYLDFSPSNSIIEKWFSFLETGWLTTYKGYRWDGVSGPMIDTRNTMRPGFVHDAGYQMLRESLLTQEYKAAFDTTFEKLMKEDWIPYTWFGDAWNWMRGRYAYLGVDLFGAKYCMPNK